MAAMVIVNNPGDWDNIYWPLGHAPWDGWTPTDLIFPFFLFIVGVSITLSRKTASTASILRRSALIVGLGLMLSGFPYYNISVMRFPGVLQRIGLCYLATAFLYRWAQGRRAPDGSVRPVVVPLVVGAVVTLVGYWIALMVIPGATGQRFDLAAETNIGAIVDRSVFGTHTWKKTWDPEGLFSTIPSIGTTLLGAITGVWFAIAGREPARLLRGLVYGGLGAALIGAAWSLQFPMIKNIWTSSYAVFSVGLGILTLAACYWLLDVRGWRRWATPLIVLGTNAITLFVVSGLIGRLLLVIRVPGPHGKDVALKTWVYRTFFEPVAPPLQSSLLFALVNLLVLYALLWWMYRRNIFIKV